MCGDNVTVEQRPALQSTASSHCTTSHPKPDSYRATTSNTRCPATASVHSTPTM